ncbi:hypothetical protein [Pseudochrobactrum kiredjianiae]|uniref:Uncharacterized protein n=1 Tax=Pseudochrobactrum kiredjianiae TaxID=386305 RepID=A0ABW3V7R3_9HYPH|nr:hypothetical protein [Pseudochrobactrum kiredjianiae]MDM7850419.1 hypothetical protein [Pseudochrobactrum kiredjianiae]
MNDEKQPDDKDKNTQPEILSSMNFRDNGFNHDLSKYFINNNFSGALKATENSLHGMKSALNFTHPFTDIMKAVEENNALYKPMSALHLNAGGALGEAVKGIKILENFKPAFSSDFMKTPKNLKSYTNSLDKLTGTSPETKSIISKAKEQKVLIDGISDGSDSEKYLNDKVLKKEQHLSASPPYTNHPAHQTNDKLASIDQRFEKMLEVMLKAASIGNDIQANAASFIDKFEVASQKTDTSARTAIRIGIIAVVIAIATPILSKIVDAYSSNPVVAAVEALSREVATSQQTQNGMVERFVTEFRDGDEAIVKGIAAELHANQEETNDLLRSLLKQLAEKPKESLPQPQP